MYKIINSYFILTKVCIIFTWFEWKLYCDEIICYPFYEWIAIPHLMLHILQLFIKFMMMKAWIIVMINYIMHDLQSKLFVYECINIWHLKSNINCLLLVEIWYYRANEMFLFGTILVVVIIPLISYRCLNKDFIFMFMFLPFLIKTY